MAQNSPNQMPLPQYNIHHYIVSSHEDDQDATFNVARNGKAFYIELSPSYFVNSPDTLRTYLSHLELLRSGEEVLDDVYDTYVFPWVMSPFLPLLVELAPPPAGDPTDTKRSLQDSLFPDFFVLHFYVVDEQFSPRRIVTDKRSLYPSFIRFDDGFLDELEQWTVLYDPAGIVLSFENPEDALFKPPRKVLIKNETITCFYKPCHSAVQAIRELKAYRAIADAGLHRGLNIGRVHGVVMDDQDFITGILLSHIDCGDVPLSCRVIPDDAHDSPPDVRRVWMQQLDTALAALHQAGIVWGDVKAENVLIDKDNNAWVTDFGGGYTPGWVDKELAETVEGDMMGMAKIRQLLFPPG